MTVRLYQSSDADAPVFDTTAGSLIAFMKACLVDGYGVKVGAGWTMPYEDVPSNLAVFRPGVGTRMYLRVDNALGNHVFARAYENMGSVSDTTFPAFPTVAQMAAGVAYYVSNSAGATRAWRVLATESIAYVFIYSNSNDLVANTNCAVLAFGDISSVVPGDTTNCILIGQTTAAVSSFNFGTVATSWAGITGHYMPKSYTDIGGSILVGKAIDRHLSNNTTLMGNSALLTYPDVMTGRLYLGEVSIHEANLSIRGILPGIWTCFATTPAVPGDTLTGSGALAGKEFMLLPASSSTTIGRLAIEISDTW